MNTDKAVIAIIDDEESVCKGLERLLRSADLTAITFLNGVDFLCFLETGWPDCVVLDLNMMPIDGFVVLESLALKCSKLPVIIMTGDDTKEAYEHAMNQGVSAYLHKPVDGQVLLDAIDDAIGHGDDNPRNGG